MEQVCKVLIYLSTKTPRSTHAVLMLVIELMVSFCDYSSDELEIITMNEWRQAICAQQHVYKFNPRAGGV